VIDVIVNRRGRYISIKDLNQPLQFGEVVLTYDTLEKLAKTVFEEHKEGR